MPGLSPETKQMLKQKRDQIVLKIEGVNRDKDLMIARKTKLQTARDKITGIIDGTITGDEAITAMTEALEVI